VDERGGLENRCGACATVGSNPTLSASHNTLGYEGMALSLPILRTAARRQAAFPASQRTLGCEEASCPLRLIRNARLRGGRQPSAPHKERTAARRQAALPAS
jgi:hypothetical protein